MAITWSDIQSWDPAHLNSASQSLSTLRQTLATEADTGANLTKAPVSSGTAFTSMMSTLGTMNTELDQLVAEVSELMMATSEAADGVWDVQTKVFECTSYAEIRGYLTINSDGTVTYEKLQATSSDSAAPNGPTNTSLKNSERSEAAKELGDLVQAALARAVEVDDAYNKRLTAVNDGTYTSSETSQSASQGLPDLPQEGWSPTEVATWWNSLTEAERNQIIAEHPAAIGNLDGIAMADRDKANRNVLLGPDGTGGQVIKDAEADLATFQSKYNQAGGYRGGNPYETELREAQQRVDDLYRLRDLVNGNGSYSLVTFDASGDGDVRAAVAVGDVDTATNVCTLVPGISTTVRSGLTGLVGDAETLRKAAGDDTAVVAWLGYDAPPGALALQDNGSQSDIITTSTADEGAEALNGFHEGIHAYHQTQGRDPYLTTVDHSYGSLTAGTAALKTKVGVVDAMTLYGSPGARASHAGEYNIPDGRVYASANSRDLVVGMGIDQSFGMDPTEMPGVTEIASDNGGHSSYWKNPEFVEDVAQIARGEDPNAK